MRPLIRSLFILSAFGVLAAQVSYGLVSQLVAGSPMESSVILVDRWLGILLVDVLGRQFAVWALLGAGGVLAVWSFVAITFSGRDTRHSTW